MWYVVNATDRLRHSTFIGDSNKTANYVAIAVGSLAGVGLVAVMFRYCLRSKKSIHLPPGGFLSSVVMCLCVVMQNLVERLRTILAFQ